MKILYNINKNKTMAKSTYMLVVLSTATMPCILLEHKLGNMIYAIMGKRTQSPVLALCTTTMLIVAIKQECLMQ